MVQVGERPRHVDGDLVPRRPRQVPPAAAIAGVRGEDPPVKGAVLHVLVDEEARPARDEAEADEADEVGVLRAGDRRHLRLELLIGVVGAAVDPLHRHRRAVVEDALVHRPRRAPPDGVLEPVRRRRQRLERELARQPGDLAEVAVLHADPLVLHRRQPPRHARRPPPLARRVVQQRRGGRRQRGGDDDGGGEEERPRQPEAEVESELEDQQHGGGRAGDDLGRLALHISAT
ncbi:Os06g0142625 [Oryza sativa Japonica Group]|uniref:Os06g0142625 protein n=1 Tax=Oryza sativa subsp. japonica TaxID=39947 RepID=A0A0P0WS97_ORYSJ|nr:hypothetical protein EE612_031867 [Oryza sativa]BAS96103.1 Os06g0142625 [Oryza sativa Japonica Group]